MERDKDAQDAAMEYPNLVKYLGDSEDIPTYNHWMYLYGMSRVSKLIAEVDHQWNEVIRKIDHYRGRELTESEEKQKKALEKSAADLEKRLMEIDRTLIKYSNAGVDRETPRKLDVTHSKKMDIKDITKLMKDAKDQEMKKKAVDADYKVKNETK